MEHISRSHLGGASSVSQEKRLKRRIRECGIMMARPDADWAKEMFEGWRDRPNMSTETTESSASDGDGSRSSEFDYWSGKSVEYGRNNCPQAVEINLIVNPPNV